MDARSIEYLHGFLSLFRETCERGGRLSEAVRVTPQVPILRSGNALGVVIAVLEDAIAGRGASPTALVEYENALFNRIVLTGVVEADLFVAAAWACRGLRFLTESHDFQASRSFVHALEAMARVSIRCGRFGDDFEAAAQRFGLGGRLCL